MEPPTSKKRHGDLISPRAADAAGGGFSHLNVGNPTLPARKQREKNGDDYVYTP